MWHFNIEKIIRKPGTESGKLSQFKQFTVLCIALNI
jgi:hypothetical protein